MMDSFKNPDKKRIEAVFKHEMPDRVPNFEVLVENPTLEYILGRDVSGKDILERHIPVAHTLDNIDPQNYIEFAEKIGQDAIGMCFYDRPFRYLDPLGNIKKLDFKIKSKEDLDRLLPLNLEHLEERFLLLDRYQEAVRRTKIGLFVLLGDFFCDTFNAIIGFEEFMYMVHDDLDLVEMVLERYAQHYIQMAEKLVRYDLSFFHVGDDIAFKAGTFIHPDIMKKLWLPKMERIFAVAKTKNLPILYHCCGNVTGFIPELMEIGMDALNPIEPYSMDIREIKKRYGKNLAYVGNMDVGGALSNGTPDQVKTEAKQLIDDVGRDGCLVLASSHSITKNVIPENFLAMVETAQTYGIY